MKNLNVYQQPMPTDLLARNKEMPTIRIPNRFYREIVEAISDGMMVVDHKGTILMVNGAMEQLTGYSRQEMVGSPCSIMDCDECQVFQPRDEKRWCALFELGRIDGKRCLVRRKDGVFVSVVKNGFVLRDRQKGPVGGVFGAIEIYTDITEIDSRDRKIRELSSLLDGQFHGMIGRSPAMKRIYHIIEKAARSDAPVIIYGESGTGKELVAHAIHKTGPRPNGPFIQFNCAALNESLLESELFGHTKGAFTGAYRHRKGRFEAANGGDIFLDEIGDIPLSTQAKLLRVLELKQFERVGDNHPVCVDVRIISATNRNLLDLIEKGKFRQDLFFRINVVPIPIPPLRERREDIPLLLKAFMERMNEKTGKDIAGVSPQVMSFFMDYHWPGNVREVKSAIEYAFVVAESGMIQFEHLPAHFALFSNRLPKGETELPSMAPEELDEKAALIDALRRSSGNKSRAAKFLGVHRMTVWNRMQKYGIHLKKTV